MEYFPPALEKMVEQFARLPGIGGLLDTGRTVPACYDAGLYTAGQTCMAVSRGLGGAPRLFNRPQLLLVELQAA